MMWLAVLSGALSLTVHAQEIPRVHRQLDVAEVWAGHPVGFCLLTTDSAHSGVREAARPRSKARIPSVSYVTKGRKESGKSR